MALAENRTDPQLLQQRFDCFVDDRIRVEITEHEPNFDQLQLGG